MAPMASFMSRQVPEGIRPPEPDRTRTMFREICEPTRCVTSASGILVTDTFVNSTRTFLVATTLVLWARAQWVMHSGSKRRPHTSQCLSGQSALLRASENPSLPDELSITSFKSVARCSSSN